jgi:sensor histidine kinase YesM
MKKNQVLTFLAFILLFSSIPGKGQTNNSVYWPFITIPQELIGRWYYEADRTFISFTKLGVRRDSQTWPYNNIKKRGDTLVISINFRFSTQELEVVQHDSKTIQIDAKHSIFLPSSDEYPFTFITMKRWNDASETPLEFREQAERISRTYSDHNPDFHKNAQIPLSLLSKEWVKKARPFHVFPKALLGNWKNTLPSTREIEQRNLTIYEQGIVTSQSSKNSYPLKFNTLQYIYGYDNVFAVSFNRDGDGVTELSEVLVELKNDTLFMHELAWGMLLGQPPLMFINQQKPIKVALPNQLLSSYLNIDYLDFSRSYLFRIYESAGTIRLTKNELILNKHKLRIKEVYKGFLVPSKNQSKSNYDIFVEDEITRQSYFLGLIFNDSFNTYFLHACNFSRQQPDGTILVLPWIYVFPKFGILSVQQFYLIFFGVPILLVAVIVYLFYRYRRNRNLRQQAQLALKGLRAQLNPHFLFNALSSIQSLVNKNDKEGANRYLSGFSKLLRHTLYHSDEDFLSLEDELANLKQYCELEALRSPFEFTIKVEEGIDVFNTEIPGMLLQPFVENAIFHGLRDHNGQPKLKIEISKTENMLTCEIVDNGPGINFTLAKKIANVEDNAHLHGMALSQERIRLLNLRLGKKIKLKVLDRLATENKTGTKVIITFSI